MSTLAAMSLELGGEPFHLRFETRRARVTARAVMPEQARNESGPSRLEAREHAPPALRRTGESMQEDQRATRHGAAQPSASPGGR